MDRVVIPHMITANIPLFSVVLLASPAGRDMIDDDRTTNTPWGESEPDLR